ncbi:glycosyltransferase family 2 protein [Bacillus sp. T3]|uniref:glycosyltransferase family 2 protein n=1 Tax=Bacillus sp. T3 TaxID=467262 RepID=UPI002981AE23|nr:glycosyltransferase [Bacillus sp. T3]
MGIVEEKPLVSIVLPVKNEGENIKNTINSLFKTKTDYPYEIIVVDDNSEDGCCDYLKKSQDKKIKLVHANNAGAALARNIGGEQATGEYVIFCDSHLFFEDYWMDRLLEPLRSGIADAINPGIASADSPDKVGYGYTWNENLEPKWNIGKRGLFASPLIASGCLAMSKKVFDDIEGYERGFRVWGKNDDDISLKLWLFGYNCYVLPEVKIRHIFRKKSPFKLTWNDINYNFMRMAYSHFNEERIEKCKKLIKHSDADRIVEEVLKGDVLEQRERYFKKRKYDDDWYMKRFNIQF